MRSDLEPTGVKENASWLFFAGVFERTPFNFRRVPLSPKHTKQDESKVASREKRNESRRRRRKELRDTIVNRPLREDDFYRMAEAERFFGYRHSRLHEAIKKGVIPKPISISDGGRMNGWFGRTIIAWQQEREAKATQQQAAQ
jgi:predicted DNA-binding transcriptional regulator AlpA